MSRHGLTLSSKLHMHGPIYTKLNTVVPFPPWDGDRQTTPAPAKHCPNLSNPGPDPDPSPETPILIRSGGHVQKRGLHGVYKSGSKLAHQPEPPQVETVPTPQ
ncbi:hypothetical protein ATANTOWER_008129 [Ataeniobius toweri]|uniref:Uncharacterized protein n=1 Tax=Ataeniobius toweri TaxID=208326 RepID=A0ABU7AWN2_9TELE|nr:hypothetical protein [Ataeniobius toweri]